MNNFVDGADEDQTPLPAPRYQYPIRSRMCPAKEKELDIAQLGVEITSCYAQRQELMPLCEKGRYWTWTMWPSIKPPLQKDIENAKGIFVAWLQRDMCKEQAKNYFSRDGPRVTIEDMRGHVEAFIEIYITIQLDKAEEKPKLSTQFLRDHSSRVFTALSRASNFITLDVVNGTYEWIDEYLSVKYDLRAHKDDYLDSYIPQIEVKKDTELSSERSSDDMAHQ